MAGTAPRESSNYYQIVLGNKGRPVLARRALPEDKNTVTRKYEVNTTKEEKEVVEVHYEGWCGWIENVTFQENDYGLQIVIHMFDETEDIKVRVNAYSGYSFDFLNRLISVGESSSLDRPLEIRPGRVQQEGKESFNYFLCIYDPSRSGAKAGQSFLFPKKYAGKDSGLPPWVPVTIQGKVQWDKTDQFEFLKSWALYYLGAAQAQNTFLNVKAKVRKGGQSPFMDAAMNDAGSAPAPPAPPAHRAPLPPAAGQAGTPQSPSTWSPGADDDLPF